MIISGDDDNDNNGMHVIISYENTTLQISKIN